MRHINRSFSGSWRGWSLVALVLCAASLPLHGATFVVDRHDDANGSGDPGDCSLREALLAAEAAPGRDTVIVPTGHHTLSIPPSGPGVLSDGALEIMGHEIEIIAPEGAVVDAQGIDRVFRFWLSSYCRVENLTITGGNVPDSVGGGVYSESSDVELENVWIHGNHAAIGGGMAIELGTVLVESSTISNNSCWLSGGGVYVFGISQFRVGRLEVSNSTIGANHADGLGGAIQRVAAGQLLLEYSTVVENTNRPDDDTISSFFPGTLTDAVYTLVEGTCRAEPDICIYLSSKAEKLPVPDLGLGPLIMNGGLTPTHALLPMSPAIDVVPLAAACPSEDQRGSARPLDGDGNGEARCDAGSFERQEPSVVEIPTLSEVGLLTLILMLAGVAVLALRR